MIEDYLDKVDSSSEDLTEEEKELYQSYLSNPSDSEINEELKDESVSESLEESKPEELISQSQEEDTKTDEITSEV
ncbi:hypothetical protein, partial [Brachyspira hampsonii]